jgi:hypothetical protein
VAHPVVHFEIIGKNPDKLQSYFGELFGWPFGTSSRVAEAVSEPTDYGFVDRITTPMGQASLAASAEVPATRPTSSSTSACPTSRPRSPRPSASAASARWAPNGRRPAW